MEEVRYSKRIRAARNSAAAAEGGPREMKSPAEKTKVDRHRPSYHPRLGVVMTDEQQDTLKRQITVFATICQQLVELHKASVAAGASSDLNGDISGQREPSATVLRAAPRHRWAPSQSQVQILEEIYGGGTGATPNKKKVKEIAELLSVHGSVTETNVYNWFQNRKAKVRRSKLRVRELDSSEGDGDAKEKKLHKGAESRSDVEEQSRVIHRNGGLRLRERFGEGASEREEIDEKGGIVLQSLQSGGSSRLSEED